MTEEKESIGFRTPAKEMQDEFAKLQVELSKKSVDWKSTKDTFDSTAIRYSEMLTKAPESDLPVPEHLHTIYAGLMLGGLISRLGMELTETHERLAACEKIARIGDQSRQYFIDAAAALGYEITITEFRPFVAGSLAGDPLTNGDWIYTWRVNAVAGTGITHFVAGSQAGEPLRDWGNERLECLISRLKPAHTLVQFAYGIPELLAEDGSLLQAEDGTTLTEE